jgi:cytochrome bd-type quinol oxidase subunit 2
MIQIFGSIKAPVDNQYFNYTKGEGLFLFISNLFKFAGVIAGIYMVIQLITAGYLYMSTEGDPKKATQAWTKIWQSILGIVIIASAFIIAGLVERFTGIKILNPEIYGPSQ